MHLQSVIVITESREIIAATHYADVAENVYNFKVRPDDVWVVTYPRSGTTLTQEMVWLIANDDYETAKNVPLTKRSSYLELNVHITTEQFEQMKNRIKDEEKRKEFEKMLCVPPWIILENEKNRRIIKSHLQFPLLPPSLLTSGCKIVYVARNPKDATLSLFKYRCPNLPTEDFPEFWNLFQNGYIENGPYWDHVIQGWNLRENKNVCFMFYEDIVKDMRGAIRKVAAFMEKDMTEEQVDKLADHLHIDNFRKNKSVNSQNSNYFITNDGDAMTPVRKGEVGDWRNYFTDELNAKANEWIEENYKKTDLRFPVDIK